MVEFFNNAMTHYSFYWILALIIVGAIYLIAVKTEPKYMKIRLKMAKKVSDVAYKYSYDSSVRLHPTLLSVNGTITHWELRWSLLKISSTCNYVLVDEMVKVIESKISAMKEVVKLDTKYTTNRAITTVVMDIYIDDEYSLTPERKK